jgi:hypothetical protein
MLLLAAMAPAFGQNLWPHADATLVDPGPGNTSVLGKALDCQFGQTYHGRCRVRTEGFTTGHARLGIKFDTGEGTPALGWAKAPGPGKSSLSSGRDWAELEVLGTVPEGATRALLHVLAEGNPAAAGARAHFQGVEFRLLPAPARPNLWPYGSATELADPGPGGIAVQAKAFQDVQAGEVFTGECLVRTAGFTTGQAEIGIQFDTGDGTPVLGMGEAMGPELRDRTAAAGPVRLGVQGRVPAGATRALVYVIARGEAVPGARATFEHVTFHRLPAAAPLRPNLWPHGCAATLADPGSGGIGVLAKAMSNCRGGERFKGQCFVRTEGFSGGLAEIGIQFDRGDGTPALDRVVHLRLAGPDWSAREVQGVVPEGATRALMYLLVKGNVAPGARAHFQNVAFHQVHEPQGGAPAPASAAAARAAAEAEARARDLDPAEVARRGAEAEARHQGQDAAAVQAAGAQAALAARDAQWQLRLAEGTAEAARRNHLEALRRLETNLGRDSQFTTQWYPRFTYNLLQDYLATRDSVETAQGAVEGAQSVPGVPGTYQVNYAYLAADPYLKYHNTDIHQVVPEDVSDAEWLGMLADLLASNQVPVAEWHTLRGPFNKVDFAPPELKRLLRKRFKRLQDTARERAASGLGPTRAEFIGTAVTPLQELAFDISQNNGRCEDGLQRGLGEIEQRLYGEGRFAHLGEFISMVLADYRMAFVQRHGELHSWDEYRTTAPLLLQQRMLFPLGLRGRPSAVVYAGRFHSGHAILAPELVMFRFLFGQPGVRLDAVHLAQGEQAPARDFEAYDLPRMLALLHEARERGYVDLLGAGPLRPGQVGMKLKLADIKAECVEERVEGGQYVARDPVLGPAWNDFELVHALGQEDNAYFAPAPAEGRAREHESNVRLRPAFWIHLLVKYGYIEKVG